MRQKLIIGNWKMHKTAHAARMDFLAFAERTKALAGRVDVGYAVPALYVAELAARRTQVGVYAQNAHWAAQGAFTGEIAAPMLSDVAARGSLVAHSERRQMNGETDATAGKRVGALLRTGLEAVLCVGETLAQRETGALKEVLTRQLSEALGASGAAHATDVLGSDPMRPLLSIAYEPVWAIGTGKAATPVEAQEAHAFVRAELGRILGQSMAAKIRILYGGSVTTTNAAGFLQCPDVDGALVGGACLDPVGFSQLCEAGLPGR